jgi:hypothetical protein
MDEAPRLRDLARRHVDLDVAGLHQRRRRRRQRRGPAAAKRGVDAGEELLDAEGLGHVVVGAEVERPHLVGLRASGRQHDDPHGRALAQLTAQLEAVDARQHEVEQHGIGLARLEHGHGVQAVLRHDDVVCPGDQVGPD